jgi:hypothetical protein
MKRLPLALALLLLGGCAEKGPFKVGDILVARSDGAVLGKVVELGNHRFENGASGPSLHVLLQTGGDAWYTEDTTEVSYTIKD